MDSEEELDESSYFSASSRRSWASSRRRYDFRTSTPVDSLRMGNLSRSFASIRSRSRTSDIERDTLLSERSTNSQGYQYFLSQQLYRRGSLSYIIHNVVSAVSSIPQSVNSWLSSSYIERPRGGPTDELDLSEIFPQGNHTQLYEYFKEREKRRSDPPIPRSPIMGSLYRSEVMRLCQMIVTKESAYDCVAEIGKANNVQFNDLNAHLSLFQRTFVRDVRRCEELERSLRFLERQIADCVPPIDLKPIDTININVPTSTQINQLENKLIELERSVRDLNVNDRKLRKQLNEMKEYQYVLQKVENFFQVHLEDEAMYEIEEAEKTSFNDSLKGEFSAGNEREMMPLNGSSQAADGKDNAWFIAGVIPCDKKLAFERVLWRACRRTAFVRMAEIDHVFKDLDTLSPVHKTVFIVFFKGESLKLIVDKVCDGFNAREYPCPKSSKERQSAIIETMARIQDLQVVIDTTQKHRHHVLSEAAVELPDWLKHMHIHKAVFHTLNNFTVDTNGFLAAECWIPENELDNVRLAMDEGMMKSGTDVAPILNVLEANRPPPTYHRLNKFTRVFQGIVDSYGVASYREINPAPYTIITFPFLFAIMFGDFAHGLILLAAGLFFVFNEKSILKKRIRDEIFTTFFGGRYIIVLMGLFSIYTGMIYNDGFAKSFDVFGSSWKNPYNQTQLNSWKDDLKIELDPKTAYLDKEGPYPFGIDPIWNIAENKLNFLNSMKMKASVIIGIAQMTFGVFLSVLNFSQQRSWVDLFTNFIPQIIFLSSIFIYLCVQIVMKWIFFSVHPGNVLGLDYPGPNCAPSLLIGLINMFMLKQGPVGYTVDSSSDYVPCYLHQWYPNQQLVENFLLAIALLCIPVMLLGKPIAHYLSQKAKLVNANRSFKRANRIPANIDEEALMDEPIIMSAANPTKSMADAKSMATERPADHAMGDVIVHQAIHTIEFVLGCVSHTASYLRLWALSLAHAQLSEVLWHMVLMQAVNAADHYPLLAPVASFFGFFVFGVLTISILVLMEGLSAFLHALRLHWVEFQSKFYVGGGYAFAPFSLSQCIETAQHLSEIDDVIGD